MSQNTALSTKPSMPLPTGSVREQSDSTLQAAIRSQDGDDREILKRAHTCLALYFDPDNDSETKLAMRESFVRALSDLPLWAILRGFDQWEKTSRRRPSPGEIRLAAEAQMRPITDELKRRDEAKKRADEEERQRRAAMPSPEAAAEILRRAGFTPKRSEDLRRAPMATTFAEAAIVAEKPRQAHWSETAAPDDPRWAVLRASRAKNPLCNPGAKNEW